ncbi:MAG: hypothetical protein Q6363_004375, partial [Candidatus Njordarchaeota archaeon]
MCNCKSIKIRWKKAFMHMRKFLSDLMPFILSHHPLCDKYKKGHYITIGRYSFCIGCTFTYPTIVIILLVQFFYRFFDFIIFDHIDWVLIASVVFLVLYGLNFFDLNVTIKILSKIYLGTLIALIILYALYVPPIPLILR